MRFLVFVSEILTDIVLQMYLSSLNWYIVLGVLLRTFSKMANRTMLLSSASTDVLLVLIPLSWRRLHPDLLCKEILSIPLSSPGLDAWSYRDLKALAHCSPWVFDSFCQLLNAIENFGRWPQSTISGFTTLIPKSCHSPDSPADLRPITVLSGLYRIWGRIRARQLDESWQNQWANTQM